MNTLKEIIKNKYVNIVNNASNNKNDTNDNKNIHALNRSIFTPNTEETLLAEKIATTLDDLQNYACYLNVVNKIGVGASERLLRSTLSDIGEKRGTKYPVRHKAKYFMYKLKFNKY